MSQLGTIFRNRREELNLTLAEVSRHTNIRVNILDALEKGKNSILPATYLRSFSKTYWQYLRLPAEDFEKAFAESGIMPAVQEQSFIGTLINPEKEKEQNESYKIPSPLKAIQAPKYSPRVVSGLISVAMILIAITGIYYLFIRDFINDTPVEPNGTASTPTEITDNTGQSTGGNLVDYFEGGAQADSIVLEVSCKESTWLAINADGQKSEEVILDPGQQKRWTATEYFLLSITINPGVVIKRNGKSLTNLGKEGDVVREMKITQDEVTTSAMPYNVIKEKAAPAPKPASPTAAKTPATSSAPKAAVKKSSTEKAASKPKAATSSKTATSSNKAKPSSSSSSKTAVSTKTTKKSTTEKSKTVSSKKKATEKSKASDKKSTKTKQSAKEVAKTKKSTAAKEPAKKKSEDKKIETPKPIQIGNTRR